MLAQTVTFLTFISNVPGSEPIQDIGCSDRGPYSVPQSHQADARVVPSIRPCLLPFAFFLAQSELLRTVMTLKNGVFWVVTPCGSCKNRRFGGTWRLLHQGDKNRCTRMTLLGGGLLLTFQRYGLPVPGTRPHRSP
jgi:hypothetical protein